MDEHGNLENKIRKHKVKDRNYARIRQWFENSILLSYDVIFTTLNYSARLRDISISTVLVDEAGQASE